MLRIAPPSDFALIQIKPAYLQPYSRVIRSMGDWGMSNQQRRKFHARPACPDCGELTYLTRRSPHPDYDLRYEHQMFTCSVCDHPLEHIVDADGKPPE